MTRLQLQWLVGFYEGEGHCGSYTNGKRKTYQLNVAITQKDKTPLLYIQKIYHYGGIRRHRKARTTLGGDVWRWTLVGAEARYFLHLILPHVISIYKRNQIITTLRKDKRRINNKYRPWIRRGKRY